MRVNRLVGTVLLIIAATPLLAALLTFALATLLLLQTHRPESILLVGKLFETLCRGIADVIRAWRAGTAPGSSRHHPATGRHASEDETFGPHPRNSGCGERPAGLVGQDELGQYELGQYELGQYELDGHDQAGVAG